MLKSNEVKVQQQGMSVGNDGSLERVKVCFGLRAAGHEEELEAVGPQLPEVGQYVPIDAARSIYDNIASKLARY